MNREQRRGPFNWVVPCLCGVATSLALGGIIGCEPAKALAPRPSPKPELPPLPVAKRQTVIVAHSEDRMAMALAPIITNSAPTIAVSEAFPSAPASSPSPKRGNVTLTWDASLDSSVVGYRVYYGLVSGWYTYSATISNAAGMPAANACTTRITGLDEGMTYYFAAVAFDASGMESVFSNEAVYTTPHYVNLRQFSYAAEAFGAYGRTNEMKMSTNLLSWWTVMSFVGDGSLQTYLHTNAAQAWFKVEVK